MSDELRDIITRASKALAAAELDLLEVADRLKQGGDEETSRDVLIIANDCLRLRGRVNDTDAKLF